MAESDLDSMKTGNRQEAAPVEADEQLVNFGESVNDVENRAAAEAAGVLDAAYIDYDEALDAYAARGDVEDLAHKNARDIPTDFSDADFMRARPDDEAGSGSGA